MKSLFNLKEKNKKWNNSFSSLDPTILHFHVLKQSGEYLALCQSACLKKEME